MPQAGKKITETILYPTPNAAAKALMPDELQEQPGNLPASDKLAKCEYAKFNPEHCSRSTRRPSPASGRPDRMAGALQDWKSQQKRPFAAIASAAAVLAAALFFVVPMAVVWLYSFGQNVGLTDIDISGTLDNYKRATEWLYLSIFFKSLAVAALVTVICLIIGFPVAMAITFASQKWRPWLLLAHHAAVLDQSADPHLCADDLMGTNGYANKGLGAVGRGKLAAQRHAAAWRRGRRFNCSTTISRWCWGWSMSTCPSWCCRSIPRSTGWTKVADRGQS
jgi:hypothetical protein